MAHVPRMASYMAALGQRQPDPHTSSAPQPAANFSKPLMDCGAAVHAIGQHVTLGAVEGDAQQTEALHLVVPDKGSGTRWPCRVRPGRACRGGVPSWC